MAETYETCPSNATDLRCDQPSDNAVTHQRFAIQTLLICPGGCVFANPEELLRYLKDEGVRFVDVRFCDLPGVMQHFNMPVESFDDAVFTEGLAFDGSSIRGFQAIHESDMLLLPDPASAFIDPFRTAKTL